MNDLDDQWKAALQEMMKEECEFLEEEGEDDDDGEGEEHSAALEEQHGTGADAHAHAGYDAATATAATATAALVLRLEEHRKVRPSTDDDKRGNNSHLLRDEPQPPPPAAAAARSAVAAAVPTTVFDLDQEWKAALRDMANEELVEEDTDGSEAEEEDEEEEEEAGGQKEEAEEDPATTAAHNNNNNNSSNNIRQEEEEEVHDVVQDGAATEEEEETLQSPSDRVGTGQQWSDALMEEEEEDEDEDDDDEVVVEIGVPAVASSAVPATWIGPDDPHRMILTFEERQWAIQIKRVIEQDPDLDNLSDFVYAQLALIERDPNNLQAVMERACHWQTMRRKNDGLLDPSCAHAQRVFKETMSLFPGHFLSFHYNEMDGNYNHVFDNTKMIATTFASNPKAMELWFASHYYILLASTCDFESIQKGLTVHVECDGFDFSKHFGIAVFSKVWSLGGIYYPIQYKIIKHYHTSVFMNTLVSMAKRFIPHHIHCKFEVGCNCESVGRLDKIYLIPNETIANQRFEQNLLTSLQRRLNNERTFSLQ